MATTPAPPLLRDVRPDDVPAVTALAVDAFMGSGLWTTLLPDPAARRTALATMFSPLIMDAVRRAGRVRLAEDAAGVAGVIVWPAPGRHTPRWWRVAAAAPRLLRGLDSASRRRLARLGPRIQRTADRAHPRERHAYLAMLSTAPRAQGQGVGRALLADGLAFVDERGLPAYLECERHLEPFYGRVGFRTRSVLADPGRSVPDQLGMWRPAQGPAVR